MPRTSVPSSRVSNGSEYSSVKMTIRINARDGGKLPSKLVSPLSASDKSRRVVNSSATEVQELRWKPAL